MGALTSKSLPFELREWDVEYFESIDPTDSFGSNTRIYIKENQIVQIEPNYNSFTYDSWITDKGRQFFDSIFNLNTTNLEKPLKSWSFVFEEIIKTIYFFDLYNYSLKISKKFTIAFENVGLELLSLFAIFRNNFSYLNVQKIEKINVFNDLESNYQLQLAGNRTKLNNSTFCLILSNNPRYESYYLNLYLKKRFSKGNFECVILGSLTNLTFFTTFVGSSLQIFVSILKGKHLICQKLKTNKRPCLILNSNFFKRSDKTIFLKMVQILKQSNILTNTWNGINIINYSLFENGVSSTENFSNLRLKNFSNFSFLYFINTGKNNINVLKKITENQLLNFANDSKNQKNHKFLILEHSQIFSNNSHFFNKLNTSKLSGVNYYFLPNTLFYENSDSFINTRGVFCKTSKLINSNASWWALEKKQSSWKALRKIINLISTKLSFCANKKDNHIISPNIEFLHNFQNYINFNYYATIGLNNLNFFLHKQNKPFINLKKKFKQKQTKIYNTKLTYWLNDFFLGGKDEFSHHSKTLSLCSEMVKKESSSMF